MNEYELLDLINQGENENIEFKSWIKTPDFKQLIKLCVKEIVALTNYNGGLFVVRSRR